MLPGRVPGDAVMTTTTQAHALMVIGGSAAATGNGQVWLTVETPRAGEFTVTGPQLGRVGLTEAQVRAQGGSVRVAILPSIAMRGAILSDPTVAEGLTELFAAKTAGQGNQHNDELLQQ